MRPTKEQMVHIMQMLNAKGILLFTFDPGTFHVTHLAINAGLAQQLENIGEVAGEGIYMALERLRRAEIAETYMFDPWRDPKYKGGD